MVDLGGMMFSALFPLILVGLVVGVLTIVLRERNRSSSLPSITERANHPLRQFQIALNAPRKQAQRTAREEAAQAAREQASEPAAPANGKPERPPPPKPRWLKQV
jgi:hypothetical protein